MSNKTNAELARDIDTQALFRASIKELAQSVVSTVRHPEAEFDRRAILAIAQGLLDLDAALSAYLGSDYEHRRILKAPELIATVKRIRGEG